VSVIDQLPPGRKKVITRAVDSMMREEVYAFVRQRIEAGEQAYIVAPAIDRQHEEEGALWERAEVEGAEGAEPVGAPVAREGPVTVTELAEQLRAGALACKVVEVLHGRVPGEQRDEIMERFRAGRVHALVATTVIEVGVDVPNATVMVVEDADRFGLATLHQLRGRVGRGGKGGVCVLIARAKTEQANARLHVMTSTGDGFELAQKDIEIRGFGDVIGVRQSGMPPFKVADLSKDLDLLTLARRDAAAWIAASPELGRAEDALARSRLLKAHGKWLGLADVG
jgi:ATP-dependent DNA helicase RecG